jgi:hypothetical protein
MTTPEPLAPGPDLSAPKPRRRRRWLSWLALACLGVVLLTGPACCLLVENLGGAFTREPEALARGEIGTGTQAMIDEALAGLPERYDVHTHVVGVGHGGTGVQVHEGTTSLLDPERNMRYRVYMSASGVSDSDLEDRVDQAYMERLIRLAEGIPGKGRHLLLAFDQAYTAEGEADVEATEFFVPSAYAFDLADARPDLFDAALSVHPYRKDALEALRTFAARGGRVVKWLPNAHRIDAFDPRCGPYFDLMRELNLTLLTHVGDEHAVPAAETQAFGNPLRNPGAKVANFDLFLRLMDDPKYAELLFGDLSAITQFNRLPRPLGVLLARDDLHPRLFNGSDYPLPAVNVIIHLSPLIDAGYLPESDREGLEEIYDVNPLLFDLVIKRRVRDPATGRRFSPSVFGAPPWLRGED